MNFFALNLKINIKWYNCRVSYVRDCTLYWEHMFEFLPRMMNRKIGFVAHCSSFNSVLWFIECILAGPFKWLTRVIFDLSMWNLHEWHSLARNPRIQSSSSWYYRNSFYSAFFSLSLSFSYLQQQLFFQHLQLQELCKVQGMWKRWSTVPALRTLPLT